MFSVQLIVRTLGKSNLNRMPYTINISGFGWNKKRGLLPIGSVLHQIVWNGRFGKNWTSDWGRHDNKTRLFFKSLYCQLVIYASVGNCSLRYSNLKIQRLITSKKDFSAGASFSMVSFWCFRAGISNDFFTVVFIRIDFKLSIIWWHPRPSQKFQLKRKRNKKWACERLYAERFWWEYFWRAFLRSNKG